MTEQLRKIHEANKHVDLKSLKSIQESVGYLTEDGDIDYEEVKKAFDIARESGNTPQVIMYILSLFNDGKLDITNPIAREIFAPHKDIVARIQGLVKRIHTVSSIEEAQNVIGTEAEYYDILISRSLYEINSWVNKAFEEIFEHHGIK